MNLSSLSIQELGDAYRKQGLSPVAVAEQCLAEIAERDGELHAFNTVVGERVLRSAARAGEELAAGIDRGPLHGVPYGVKDVIETKGILTTCQSRLFADNVPSKDAEIITRLEDAGAVLLGKCATYEFANGGPALDLALPPARNPWNLAHIPGGSSSGSAAAVAAGFCRFALGTDTGGSIRSPAALCGLVGIKPTFGSVSTQGIIRGSPSLDTLGVIAASVPDAAAVLQVMQDPRRGPSGAGSEYGTSLREGVRGLRIGRLSMDGPGADDLRNLIDGPAAAFKDLGAVVEDVQLPHLEAIIAVGWIIALGESYNLHKADLRERAMDYGRRTRERLICGSFVDPADVLNARELKPLLTRLVDELVFKRYDIVLAPATPGAAPRFEDVPDAPITSSFSFMLPFNVTGHPAMTLPIGFDASGLPLSMQLVAPHHCESRLFMAGNAYEQTTHWFKNACAHRRPSLTQ